MREVPGVPDIHSSKDNLPSLMNQLPTTHTNVIAFDNELTQQSTWWTSRIPLKETLFDSYKHKELQDPGWRGSPNPRGGLEAQTLGKEQSSTSSQFLSEDGGSHLFILLVGPLQKSI